jgi:hypothetical protein
LKWFIAGAVKYLVGERADEKQLTVFSEAIEQLRILGLCDAEHPITPRTLKNWYIAERKKAGEPITRGRPRSRE